MAEKQDTETRRQTVEQLLKQVADKAIAEGHRVSFGEITRTDKGYETVMTLQERYFVKCGAKDHIYTMTIPLSDLSIPALRDVIKKPHSQARSLLPAFHADLAQNLCKGIYNGCNDILCRAEAQEQRRYELYGRPIKVGDHVLRRIRATQEFTSGRGNVIKPGQVGGYVENFDNLMGKAWVHSDAKVYDKARVHGSVIVSDHAEVFGEAVIEDNALITGNAKVEGNALVNGQAFITGDAKVRGFAHVGDEAIVTGYGEAKGYARVLDKAKVLNNAIICEDAELRERAVLRGVDLLRQDFVAYGSEGNSKVQRKYHYNLKKEKEKEAKKQSKPTKAPRLH